MGRVNYWLLKAPGYLKTVLKMQTGHLTAIATILLGLNTICCLRPTRHLDSSSSNELMLEDGVLVPANPSCEETWYYHNTSCYWFSTTRMDFHPAMESCAEKGAYLTDILSQEENTFLKDILMVINPKDGPTTGREVWSKTACAGSRAPPWSSQTSTREPIRVT